MSRKKHKNRNLHSRPNKTRSPASLPMDGSPSPDAEHLEAEKDPASGVSPDAPKVPESPCADKAAQEYVSREAEKEEAVAAYCRLMAEARKDDAALAAARLRRMSASAEREAADLRKLLRDARAEVSGEDPAPLPELPPGEGMEELPPWDDGSGNQRPGDGRRFTEKLQYKTITVRSIDDLARVFSSASRWAGYRQLMDELRISRRTAQRLVAVVRHTSPDDARILLDQRPAAELVPAQGLARLRPQFLIDKAAARLVYKTAFMPHRGNPYFKSSTYQAELSSRRYKASVSIRRESGEG